MRMYLRALAERSSGPRGRLVAAACVSSPPLLSSLPRPAARVLRGRRGTTRGTGDLDALRCGVPELPVLPAAQACL